jgi:DNA (cytosine-5)-methyltransferase 1
MSLPGSIRVRLAIRPRGRDATQMTQMTQKKRAAQSRETPAYTPTVIDLFSGAGGTGLGFRRAGFNILGAVELDKHAAETYEKNLGVEVKVADIREFSPKKYRKELKLRPRRLDVLVGCPPCQGFSRMRNGNGGDDERNDLVLRYLEFVREFMPRFAVFENVPGLLRTKYGRKFYRRLYAGLEGLRYKVRLYEEDAADYGTPQRRKRVIVIAGRFGEEPPSLQKTHGNPKSNEVREGELKPWVTVRDAIGNFPVVAAGGNGQRGRWYRNHVAPVMGDKVRTFIRRVPHDGGSRREVPKRFWLKCHREHGGHNDVYGRLEWDEPSNTITCGCTNVSKGRFVHPEQDRALTYSEAAALQGFDKKFVFHGANLNEQIGNAVPPLLALAIAVALKSQILERRPLRKRRSTTAPGTIRIVVSPAGRSRVRNRGAVPVLGRLRRARARAAIPKAA